MALHLARISTSVLISVSISLHISGDFVRQCFWHKHIYIYIDVCFPITYNITNTLRAREGGARKGFSLF